MFLQSKLDLLCQQIKVEKSMNRLTFIGSIQLNSPSTGGGVQTKNQHFLRYILSKNVDCRVFDTWKKKSVLSLIMSLIYIV